MKNKFQIPAFAGMTMMAALTLLVLSSVAHADLQNFVRLHDYFDDTLKIQAGSFVGRGLTSDQEYQLTLVQYSPQAKETFVVVLEKLDSNLKIVHARAYFSTPITDTQTDLFEFVLDKDKTMLLPPFEGKAQMTLNLTKIEKDRMMLELKPLQSDPQFGEVIRFHWGRIPHVYAGLQETRFSSGKNELRLWSDNEGSWAELTIADNANAGGTFRVSDEGIPGLFVLRRIVKDRYSQEESEHIAYVFYCSRRVSKAFLGMGRHSTKFVTTLPTLSEHSWELDRD